ncbi:MAG: hypothetical protein GY772_13910 [bacterium]|nr:hypothetical protein [bacterium]MDP6243704.1 high-potential iron-sulfur protein [Myxococcota bacterium]HJO22754.1 high-potential iron-sulfur protein [Myxococcota bacterium]
MTGMRNAMTESRVDRRGFVGIGLRAVAAVFALPAAASLLASCGNGEQPAAPQAPSPPPDRPAAPQAPSPPKAAAPAAPPVPAASPPGGGTEQLITEIAGSAAMVQALQYVNQSAKPDQNCGNCQLYTAQSGGVGKCQLFATGLVKEAGWCASWAAKVTAENS